MAVLSDDWCAVGGTFTVCRAASTTPTSARSCERAPRRLQRAASLPLSALRTKRRLSISELPWLRSTWSRRLPLTHRFCWSSMTHSGSTLQPRTCSRSWHGESSPTRLSCWRPFAMATRRRSAMRACRSFVSAVLTTPRRVRCSTRRRLDCRSRRGPGAREAAGDPLALLELPAMSGEREDGQGQSRAVLRAARDTFDALGCAPWSDQARRELRASGERSRRRVVEARDQLTGQELQIAQLAAAAVEPRDRPAPLPLASHDQHALVPGISETRDHLACGTLGGAGKWLSGWRRNPVTVSGSLRREAPEREAT